jgi:excisionase family DNA binding protein
MQEKLWTAAQAAEFLSLGKRRVYQLAGAGLLPTVWIGRGVRFDPDAIRAFVAQGGQRLAGDGRRAERGA